jgi:Tol biopolymer transport system component
MQMKDWLARLHLPWSNVKPRVVILLALWLALFLLTACLLIGRLLLLSQSNSAAAESGPFGSNIFPGFLNFAKATEQSGTSTPTPGRLTAVVLTQIGVAEAYQQTQGGNLETQSGTLLPGTGTALSSGYSSSGNIATPTWDPLTPIFRVTSFGTATPTWFIRYYTPRPTVLIPLSTATRTFTPWPTLTPLPPTLLPEYRTGTAAAYQTGTASIQTSTAAVIQTGTASVNQTGTAVVVQTQTQIANQTATSIAAVTATAVAKKPLAFSADEPGGDGSMDLQVIGLDGSSRMMVYRAPDSAGALLGSWSPDDKWLVFEGICGNPPTRTLCIIHPDGTGLATITNLPQGRNSEPAWSPDGQSVVFKNTVLSSGQEDLFMIHLDGSGLIQLTNDIAHDSQPDWSPDSKMIVFISDRSSTSDIYSLDVSGMPFPAPVRLSLMPGLKANPHFSPDGKWLVFSSSDGTQSNIHRAQLGAFPDEQSLTTDSAQDILPSWSPDGSKVLFVSNRNGNDELWTMNADGSSQTVVPNSVFPVIGRAAWLR